MNTTTIFAKELIKMTENEQKKPHMKMLVIEEKQHTELRQIALNRGLKIFELTRLMVNEFVKKEG